MLDARIRFRHLQCFLTIAQKKSVGRAADALSVTQPALSKTLRELEDALGVRLFERDKKGMMLTQFGEVFIQHASSSISSLRHGIESIKLAQSRDPLGVSVGVLPNTAARLMPAAVKQFKETAPTINVRIFGGGNARLLDLLRLGELDIVVGRLARPEQLSGLTFEHLYSERIVVVVRANHPLAEMRSFKAEQVARFPLVLPNRETIVRHEIDRFLITRGIDVAADLVETTATEFALAYMQQTNAIWFAPYGAVASDLTEGRVVELKIDEGSMDGPVGMTSRLEVALSPAAQLMARAIRTVSHAPQFTKNSHLIMMDEQKGILRGQGRSAKQKRTRRHSATRA